MLPPTLFHLGWTNSRAQPYHGWTNSQTGEPNVNAPVPPEGALLGAWQGPLHLATFPGIFSELTRYNFHVAGAAIVLSQSSVVKG